MPNASHFYSGWDVFRTTHEQADCGCYCEAAFSPDDELLELRVLICEQHMQKASEAIDFHMALREQQLTFTLPSPRATGGESDTTS